MSISYKEITKADKQLWNDFVDKNHGSIFQRFEWSIILNKSYGYKPYFIGAFKDNKLVGILPACFRGRFSGQTLTSLPFTDYSGPLGLDENIESGLIENLINQSSSKKLKGFVINSTRKNQSPQNSNYS